MAFGGVWEGVEGESRALCFVGFGGCVLWRGEYAVEEGWTPIERGGVIGKISLVIVDSSSSRLIVHSPLSRCLGGLGLGLELGGDLWKGREGGRGGKEGSEGGMRGGAWCIICWRFHN